MWSICNQSQEIQRMMSWRPCLCTITKAAVCLVHRHGGDDVTCIRSIHLNLAWLKSFDMEQRFLFNEIKWRQEIRTGTYDLSVISKIRQANQNNNHRSCHMERKHGILTGETYGMTFGLCPWACWARHCLSFMSPISSQ